MNLGFGCCPRRRTLSFSRSPRTRIDSTTSPKTTTGLDERRDAGAQEQVEEEDDDDGEDEVPCCSSLDDAS